MPRVPMLLRQALPDATAAEIKARLVDKTRTDEVVKSAGPTVAGRGRLDVLNALGLKEPTGAPPSFALEVKGDGTGEVQLEPAISAGDRAGMKIRWDLDYDGVADTEWEPAARGASDRRGAETRPRRDSSNRFTT